MDNTCRVVRIRDVVQGREYGAMMDCHHRCQGLAARWPHASQRERWNIIRSAYSLQLPFILSGPVDPYFLPWQFTPIEELAWQDIRSCGLKLYPQFPALQYFIDFADPVLQIGVELDGKDYHRPERDRARDQRLWEFGWRIFRIPGRESLPCPQRPEEITERISELRAEGEPDAEYSVRRAWGARWSEGFFWALGVIYYGSPANREAKEAAEATLRAHQYVQFPIELDGQE